MASKVINKISPLVIFRNNRFFEINNAGEELPFKNLLRNRLNITIDEETAKKERILSPDFPDLSELFDFVTASKKSKSLLAVLDFNRSFNDEMTKRSYRAYFNKSVAGILHHVNEEQELTTISNNHPGVQKYV